MLSSRIFREIQTPRGQYPLPTTGKVLLKAISDIAPDFLLKIRRFQSNAIVAESFSPEIPGDSFLFSGLAVNLIQPLHQEMPIRGPAFKLLFRIKLKQNWVHTPPEKDKIVKAEILQSASFPSMDSIGINSASSSGNNH